MIVYHYVIIVDYVDIFNEELFCTNCLFTVVACVLRFTLYLLFYESQAP